MNGTSDKWNVLFPNRNSQKNFSAIFVNGKCSQTIPLPPNPASPEWSLIETPGSSKLVITTLTGYQYSLTAHCHYRSLVQQAFSAL